MEHIMNLPEIEFITCLLKMTLINLLTYFFCIKITNQKNIKTKKFKVLGYLILNSCITAVICYSSNYINGIMIMLLGLSVLFIKLTKCNITYSILSNIVAMSITYIIYFISILISFIPSLLFKIQSNIVNLMIIIIICIIETYIFNKIKKFKYGFSFLKKDFSDGYLDILIMNLSVILLFCFLIFPNFEIIKTGNFFYAFIIFSIIMFITIQKSLQLYYKQKLQQKELEETKEELAKAKQEIKELEQENLNFSKKSHSIAHKQKALEYKLNQLLLNNEIAEKIDIKDKLKEISKQIQNEDTTIELTKTNIEEIDDMLKYIQSECKKNKINFELQINGNIHHMVNKLIPKENVEILLADHIKNAIIAINHSENINRSILVKLGLIDGIYSIYIYDTGIEFEIKTLQNLGQVPSTTHADNGGTGMGFMNTFDTLNKYKASITINEYGKPSKDNYTKYIAIKFDNKNEYKITSYRSEEIEKQIKENRKITVLKNKKN